MHYRDLFPEHSGDGKMTDLWWARYGVEEAALDAGKVDGEFPAHDRLDALLRGERPDPPALYTRYGEPVLGPWQEQPAGVQQAWWEAAEGVWERQQQAACPRCFIENKPCAQHCDPATCPDPAHTAHPGQS